MTSLRFKAVQFIALENLQISFEQFKYLIRMSFKLLNEEHEKRKANQNWPYSLSIDDYSDEDYLKLFLSLDIQ